MPIPDRSGTRRAVAPRRDVRGAALWRRGVAAGAIVALAAALAVPAHAASPAPWRGGPTPPLVLKDLEGREVRLDAYRGRTVVENFWATWCAPCVEEMPSLMRLRERVDSLDPETFRYRITAREIVA
jgi:hypothetical protein